MHHVILILACLMLCQLSFTQSEKLEVEGAVLISDNTSSNPKSGTIRWTGQDFEGFNGSVWKSLTDCSSITDPKGLWPDFVDSERLLGGVAYGNYLRTGTQVGNSISAFDHAVLVRAWKTGTVTGFQFHNRTPSSADLAAVGGTERWRSFMINSYRAGNGGTYEPALHRCDDNMGIGELISKGSLYVLWPLDQPGNTVILNPYRGANWSVVAGEWYWLVLENLTPPPSRGPVDAATAESWGNNVGYTALNGNQRPEKIPGVDNIFGAIGGKDHTRHLYKDGGTVWNEWTRETPWIQFHYSDGVEVGDMQIVFNSDNDYSGSPTHFIHEVQGQRRIRQRLRFPYAATRFDRVEVFFGHKRSLPMPNGSPLIVEVKTLAGTLLATAQVPPMPIVWTLSDTNDGLPNEDRDGKGTDRERRVHVMADLDRAVTLNPNQDYVIEMSAASGANFRIPSTMTANNMKPQPTREWLSGPEDYAEWSDNGGTTWQIYQGGSTYTKDIPVLLFVEGVPLDADGVVTGN